jgi:hypothetical protein
MYRKYAPPPPPYSIGLFSMGIYYMGPVSKPIPLPLLRPSRYHEGSVGRATAVEERAV